MDLKLSVTEPQARFHALTCKYPLFVAGYGAGKSETLINQAIMDSFASPNAVIALYAPTYDLVKLILAPRLIAKLEHYGIDYKYNKAENTVVPNHPQMGTFILRTLDNPERIVGYESYRAHIDEIDTLPEAKAQEVWRKIIARNRQQIGGTNRVSAYTTPEGFRFVYRQWAKSDNPEYGYVKASSSSNPFLPEGYIDSLLATYPSELIRAYLEGEFVNLTSGTVYCNYERNMCSSSEEIRPNETLFIGCDFNVTRQAATVYVKRDGGKEWHAVDELCDMYDTPDMIRTINNRYPGHRIVIYPDASGGSRKTVDANSSDISLLRQAGFEVRVNKQNPSIRDRVLAMNKALENGTVKINESKCPTTASCLEQQAYDKNGMPDKRAGNDHQNDATTYPIAYEFPIRKPVAHIATSYL